MTESEFTELFDRVIADAKVIAEAKYGLNLPIKNHFYVNSIGDARNAELHIPKEELLKKLYLGPSIYFLIIDIILIGFDADTTKYFVRPSNHTPGLWKETFDTPPGNGPFKISFAFQLNQYPSKLSESEKTAINQHRQKRARKPDSEMG